MGRRNRVLLSVAGAAVMAAAATLVALLSAAAPAAADPPSAPYTAWTLDGNRSLSTWLGHALDVEDLTVTTAPVAERFTIDGHAEGNAWHLLLYPPSGTTWAVGTYPVTDDGGSPTSAYFDLSRSGSSCFPSSGSLTVLEVARTDGMLSAFAASFAVPSCGGISGMVRGEVRWNSAVGWQAAIGDQRVLKFGGSPTWQPSAPMYYTLTSRGSLPTTFGTAQLELYEETGFSIISDTCSGTTLSYDESCAVGVVADGATPGPYGGDLIIPNDTPGGESYVNLQASRYVEQFPPIPSPTLTPPAGWDNTGTFYALPPARILDTRFGNGAAVAKVGAGATLKLRVAGRGGVPSSGVSAVVLNVTVTNGTAPSYLTVYPQGQTRPTASSLNFVGGWTGANMVTVGLGATGDVSIFNNAGKVDVIADVTGYYAANGSMISTAGTGTKYHPVVPFRLYDSREKFGPAIPYPEQRWHKMGVDFGTTINPHVRALAVNVTALSAYAPGFLTTWDGYTSMPLASTLNYTPGAVVPNMAVVPISRCTMECTPLPDTFLPAIKIYSSGASHVIVDVIGYYDDGVPAGGLRFAPVPPTRIVDSREHQGLPGALGLMSTGTVTVPGGILTPGTTGVALNVTAVNPTAYGYVSVWPAGVARPLVSNLNTAPGQTLPNSVYTLLGSGGAFQVYNHNGKTHIVVDVVGRFYQ